jgi:aspartyl-tRNA(Asn)/glutamyl-tRNA(Gln) amidotransferase subunit C
MALDKQTVFKIARLARIYVDDVDVERYASELSSILEFVEQMDKVDTDNVAPLSHPQDRVLRLREDKVTEKDQRDIFQDVAPATENGLYLVPKVID